MVLNLATVEDLHAMKGELVCEIKMLLRQGAHGIQKRWLKTEEVVELLQLSASTLQTLRRNGTLPFSRMGATIFYDIGDIDRILEERKQRQLELIGHRKERRGHKSGKGDDWHDRSAGDLPLAA